MSREREDDLDDFRGLLKLGKVSRVREDDFDDFRELLELGKGVSHRRG